MTLVWTPPMKPTVVPFLLKDELEERGAAHTAAQPVHARVVRARRLVTGQNPQFAEGISERCVGVLKAARA